MEDYFLPDPPPIEETSDASMENSRPTLPVLWLVGIAIGIVVLRWWWVSGERANNKAPTEKELAELREKRARALSRNVQPNQDTKEPSAAMVDGSKPTMNRRMKEEQKSVRRRGERHADASTIARILSSEEEYPEETVTTKSSMKKTKKKLEEKSPAKKKLEEESPAKNKHEEESPVKETVTPKSSTKKLARLFSPAQVLCEALSQIFKCQVMVLEPSSSNNQEEVGTWGGHGWRRRPTEYPNGPVVELDLVSHYSASKGESWEALVHVFGAVLDNDQLADVLLGGHNLRVAALCHARALALARNGLTTMFSPQDNDDFAYFVACTKTLNRWIIQHVIAWIRPQIAALQADMDHEDDDESVDDLFSDETYNAQDDAYSSNRHQHSSNTRTWDQLRGLLEESNGQPLSRDFVEQLVEAYGQNGILASILLEEVVKKNLASALRSNKFSSSVLTSRSIAVSNLLSLSPSVCAALANQIVLMEEAEIQNKNGRQVQEWTTWSPLFEAVAYTIPEAGTETRSGPNKGALLQQLDELDNFPLCVFRSDLKDRDETNRVLDDAQRTMKMARMSAEAALRVVFKASGDKDKVFRWIGNIIRSNEQLVDLLKSDLLQPDGVIALSSSLQFLLGLTSALASFCNSSLVSRFDTAGFQAFDVAFLADNVQEYYQEPVEETNRMFQGQVPSEKGLKVGEPKEFGGATQFFFLSSLFLRVVVRTALRMEGEFYYRYNKILANLQGIAKASDPPPPDAMESMKPVVAAWLGWKTFLEDRDFTFNITELALIQLGWLVEAARTEDVDRSLIPDWMCREPARWLSHLAQTSPFLLKPRQAEKAVNYATALLELGSPNIDPDTERRRQFAFSPIVVSSLIGIASAFVRAGVNRARNKQRRKHPSNRRGFGGRAEENLTGLEEPDEQDLDVYLSFDQTDLGVTVFTSPSVREKLCPTLLRTFLAVSVVEGFDADKDDSFSKLGARSEIAELLLRLWCHPTGDCRESFASLPGGDILAFASSLSVAAGVDLDFGSGALERLFTTTKGRPLHQFARTQLPYLEMQASQAAGMLFGTRMLLGLLCTISTDKRISAHLGGHTSGIETVQLVDLANMIVHFLEKLTSVDGGTNSDLEERSCEPTSRYLDSNSKMLPIQKERLVEDVLQRRISAKTEYGLDVGTLCHQLLALTAKWHLTAAKAAKDGTRTSRFLLALAEHEDWDQTRAENVYRRLVAVPDHNEGNTKTLAYVVLEHDGYIDHTPWLHKYIDAKVSESQKKNRRTAQQYQMPRRKIAELASLEDIRTFLDDLRNAVAAKAIERNQTVGDPSEISSIEDFIMCKGATAREDQYSENLSEWLVSSEPFQSTDGRTFAHCYDKAARSCNIASGKTLQKEARKCHKTLPEPTADSASFICFAEERMDLCRAIVSGPVDTPYAHGLFVFDVFFGSSYPEAPPLITFMTTGGGRVRMNPNLYTDGKVCISILGVTNATDGSQRWNPKVSSLAQVILSIQSQILGVPDPYFNEGNGVPEHLRYTPEGREGSMKYNNQVRLATLRFAIVEHHRSPPKGFEEVTLRHFALCRRRIVAQARRWMLEARGTSNYSKYERAYAELLTLLATKKDALEKYGALPPLQADLEALETLDSSFCRRLRCRGGGVDSSLDNDEMPASKDGVRTTANVASSSSTAEDTFNPWANNISNDVQVFHRDDDEDTPASDEELYE